MSLSKLEHELLRYLINDEPFHILIAGFANGKIDKLISAIINLMNLKYIECFSSDKSEPKPLKIGREDLLKYVEIRTKSKETLEEYPGKIWEYNFYITETGIKQLSKKDKEELGIKDSD
jgi:hypothetical protein